MLTNEYELKVFKARAVKTPEKFGNAAGWDFYIPNDLTIFDFMNNPDVYVNDFVDSVSTEEKTYILPLEFYVTINGTEQVLRIAVDTETFVTTIICELEFDETALKTCALNKIKLLPNSKILIPSGIHVNLPMGICLVGENKSGISAKRGLIKGAQVIDQDYQGQIHINLINTNNYAVSIRPGEKIIQFVPYFQPVMKTVTEFSSKETLYAETESIRGEGGFGSSGIK